MPWKDIKLEKRPDNEPKYDKNNKTDRKIVRSVILITVILLVLIGGCFALFYILFNVK